MKKASPSTSKGSTSKAKSARPGAKTVGFAPLVEIREAVARLEADKNVFVEKFEVRPPAGRDVSALPREWQDFYAACDGLVLRWRHRQSRRDQDWVAGAGKTFDSLRPTKKLPDVWALDHQITAFVDIPPAQSLTGRNKYWDEYVKSIARTDAAKAKVKVDGKSMPFIDANRLVRPFDVFSPSEHVFVRTDNWQLLLGSDSNAELEFKNQLGLSEYLHLLAATYGASEWRARFFRAGGKLKPRVELSKPESILFDNYEPSAEEADATVKTSSFWAGLKAPRDIDQRFDVWAKVEKKLDKLSPDKVEVIARAFFAERTPNQLHPYEEEFLSWLRFRPIFGMTLSGEIVDAVFARMDSYQGEAGYPRMVVYFFQDTELANPRLRARLPSLTLPESCWSPAVAYAIEVGIKLDDQGQQCLRDAIVAKQQQPDLVKEYKMLLKHGTSLKSLPT